MTGAEPQWTTRMEPILTVGGSQQQREDRPGPEAGVPTGKQRSRALVFARGVAPQRRNAILPMRVHDEASGGKQLLPVSSRGGTAPCASAAGQSLTEYAASMRPRPLGAAAAAAGSCSSTHGGAVQQGIARDGTGTTVPAGMLKPMHALWVDDVGDFSSQRDADGYAAHQVCAAVWQAPSLATHRRRSSGPAPLLCLPAIRLTASHLFGSRVHHATNVADRSASHLPDERLRRGRVAAARWQRQRARRVC